MWNVWALAHRSQATGRRMTRLVMAIDPGGDTGWVWAMVPGRRDPSVELGEARASGRMEWGELGGEENEQVLQIREIWVRALRRYRLSVRAGQSRQTRFVCESFQLRESTSDPSLLSPVRIQSKLELLLYTGNIQADVYQTYQPSQKSVITDERLKRWGLWLPGQRHARDAMRHVALDLRSAD